MRRLISVLLAATISTATAQLPLSWQHAIITKSSGTAPAYTLTVDFVDVFIMDSIPDYQRAKKLGVVKTLDEFQNLSPSGIYVNNVNPKLRTLKTDKNTKYELVCLSKPGNHLMVDARTFMVALSGKTVQGCWPMSDTVKLTLQGERIEQISQVYFP